MRHNRPTPARGGVRQGDAISGCTLRAVRSEAAFQAHIEQFAALCGWICWHDHDSRRNLAGFPDLLLLRERVVWIECKTERGRLSVAQVRFIDALQNAGQEVYVARPSNVDEIERVLV